MAMPAENFLHGSKSEHGYLVGLTLRACQIAKSAAANAAEALGTSVPELYGAVDECERELDRLDRELDQRICGALEETSEPHRRELLACMKCMTDLERIGDLIASFTTGARALGTRMETDDVHHLIRMTLLLDRMLTDVYQAFSTRDMSRAVDVFRADGEIDHHRNVLFVRHVENSSDEPRVESVRVLLMAQALERAGDHAKNLAEELYHLVEGHSMRHLPKKKLRD
jgi:phosphate transport system protein